MMNATASARVPNDNSCTDMGLFTSPTPTHQRLGTLRRHSNTHLWVAWPNCEKSLRSCKVIQLGALLALCLAANAVAGQDAKPKPKPQKEFFAAVDKATKAAGLQTARNKQFGTYRNLTGGDAIIKAETDDQRARQVASDLTDDVSKDYEWTVAVVSIERKDGNAVITGTVRAFDRPRSEYLTADERKRLYRIRYPEASGSGVWKAVDDRPDAVSRSPEAKGILGGADARKRSREVIGVTVEIPTELVDEKALAAAKSMKVTGEPYDFQISAHAGLEKVADDQLAGPCAHGLTIVASGIERKYAAKP